MEAYNEAISENSKVALIHVSRDRSDDDAETWAVESEFPWMTVLPDDVERSDLMEYRTGNAVPHYSLRNADGSEVVNGLSSVLAKIKEIGEGS